MSVVGVVGRAPLSHRLCRRAALMGLMGAGSAWRRALSRRPLPPPGLVRTSPDLVMALDPADWLSVEIYRGFHERHEISLLRHLVPDGGVAVDVGAHLGYYTAVLACLAGAGGTVLAFEPSPPRLEVLGKVIASMAQGNVTLRAVALGAVAESRTLKQVESAHSGLATLRSGVSAGSADVEVEVVPLADVPELRARTVGIDLLKVDVEGFEPQVLAGAAPLFDEQRIRHALVEVSPNFGSTEWAADLLDRYRHLYSAFAVTGSGRVVNRPALEPLTPRAVVERTTQFNMLLSLRQSVVTRFVTSRRER